MLYILTGLLIIGILILLKKNNPDNAGKYLIIAAGIIVAFVLLRFGQPLIAGLIGLLLAGGASLRKLLQIAYTLKSVSGLFKKTQSERKTDGKMTKSQALEVLGVSEKATKKEIKEAYQRLMKKNHPDTGGSKYLAAKLNQAKDILLS